MARLRRPFGSRSSAKGSKATDLDTTRRRITASTTILETTITNATQCEDTPAVRVRKASDKQVHFDTTDHVTVLPAVTDADTKRSQLWYTETDYHQFKSDSKIHVKRVLQRDHARADPWCPRLLRVWQEFCSTGDDAEAQLGLMLTGSPVDATMVGMEKWMLPAVSMDTASRRRRCFATVRLWQDDARLDPRTRAARISQACLEANHPAQLFAQYLAAAAATDSIFL